MWSPILTRDLGPLRRPLLSNVRRTFCSIGMSRETTEELQNTCLKVPVELQQSATVNIRPAAGGRQGALAGSGAALSNLQIQVAGIRAGKRRGSRSCLLCIEPQSISQIRYFQLSYMASTLHMLSEPAVRAARSCHMLVWC
jgi:hypothetical protein